jgi:hypothetical protein
LRTRNGRVADCADSIGIGRASALDPDHRAVVERNARAGGAIGEPPAIRS